MIKADLDRERELICSRQLRKTSDLNEYPGKVGSFHESGRHCEELPLDSVILLFKWSPATIIHVGCLSLEAYRVNLP